MPVLLTQTIYNAPYGFEFTSQRNHYHGALVFAAGSYITGGLLPNWNNTTAMLTGLSTTVGVSALIAAYTIPPTALITAVTVTGTTVVSATKATPTLGQYVTFGQFTALTLVPLNGITAQVTAVTAGVSFTVIVTTTAVTTVGLGQATTVIGPDSMWIESVASTGYVYAYNKANGLVQIFTGAAAQSPLTELAAGALPAGVLTDIIEYEMSFAKQ